MILIEIKAGDTGFLNAALGIGDGGLNKGIDALGLDVNFNQMNSHDYYFSIR